MPQGTAATLAKLKKYCGNFRACYYYFNKSVRNPRARNTLHKVVRNIVPRAAASPAAQGDIARLRSEGILMFEPLIDAATVDAIRSYLLTKPVYNWVDADFKGQMRTPLDLNEVKITKQTKLKYFDEDIAQCREIIELGNSPKILSLVSAYLGCKPTIATMSAWWTKTGSAPAEKFYDDMFHRDADDYKFIKLFVYLNDVGPENGAHCFVRRSHLSEKCTERRPFTDEEVAANFDAGDQLIITGKSGFGFLEDTWGLHRSTPCLRGERLVVQFLYSLTSFNAQTTPRPVAKNTFGVDAYTNRVYLYS